MNSRDRRSTEGLTRRELLAAAAGGGALLAAPALHTSIPQLPSPALAAEPSSVKIDRIETFVVPYTTAGRFKFFEDVHGRPIGRPTVVVKLTADDGSVGWGQSVPSPRWSYETIETVTTTIAHYLAPVLRGMDIADMEAIHRVMNVNIAPSFSTGQPICKAGIDLALFDLEGRRSGQSPAERWNRVGRDRVVLSWTLNPERLDDVERLVEEGRQRGYDHFNVKVAPDLQFDLAMCRMIKRLVPDGFLWVDANGGYDIDTALEAARQLADAGAAVLEQPLPINRFMGYRRLRQLKALPIIMDEGIVSLAELEQFHQLGLLDGLAIKPARCGGLTEARRQIEYLHQHGLMFLGSGLTDPDLALAASLALYGAYDLQYPAALNGPQFLAGTTILRGPLEPIDGQLAVPTGPGLGVDVDPEQLDRLASRG